jgi:hypothetical protein
MRDIRKRSGLIACASYTLGIAFSILIWFWALVAFESLGKYAGLWR